MNGNVEAFLMTVRACEGTDSPDGYRALFGYTPSNGKVFDNGFARHPNIRSQFTQTDGTVNFTTAAGAYQFIFPTWTRLQALLHLPDFSPASQDAAATQLIVEVGAIGYVSDGYLQASLDRCATVWASLPSSKYPQPHRSLYFCESAFIEAGGSLG